MSSDWLVPLTVRDVRSLRGSSASIIELLRRERREPLVFRCVRGMIAILPLVLRPARAGAEENSNFTYSCRKRDPAPSLFLKIEQKDWKADTRYAANSSTTVSRSASMRRCANGDVVGVSGGSGPGTVWLKLLARKVKSVRSTLL